MELAMTLKERLHDIFGNERQWPLGIHWPWAGVYAAAMLIAELADRLIF